MITDRQSLEAVILAWLERDGDTALEGQVGTIIQNAESWLNRKLLGYQREVVGTLAVDADGYAALPTGALGIAGISYLGIPKRFQVSGTQIYVPNYGNYTLDIVYYSKLMPLEDDADTNWLLEVAPDAYLYACLSQASIFAQDIQNASVYASQAEGILNELILQNTVAQYGRAGLSLPRHAP